MSRFWYERSQCGRYRRKTRFNGLQGEQAADQAGAGHWIAEVPDLPGVMVYGSTREEALGAVQALALRVLADRIEHGELPPGTLSLSFEAA